MSDTLDYTTIDSGIVFAVRVLRAAGIDTFASCQGGEGHGHNEPVVLFHGARHDALRALAAALEHGLPVQAVRDVWPVYGDDLGAPYWEMVFMCHVEEPVELDYQNDPQGAERKLAGKDDDL